MTDLELELLSQIRMIGMPEPEVEYVAIPGRKFRHDMAFVDQKVLIEIQGGIYSYKPSHASAGGIRRDCEKANLAVANGWRLFHFTPDMVRSGEAVKMIEEAL
jgi:very-short-patch-repair endonuclease